MPNTTKIGSIVRTTTTATFSPTSITGCQLWYDGADSTSMSFSSGSNVSQWNDKSGNGYHLLQPTVANQPTRSAIGLNFTTSQTMTKGSAFSLPLGSITIFIVNQFSSSSIDNSVLFELYAANGGTDYLNQDYIFISYQRVPQTEIYYCGAGYSYNTVNPTSQTLNTISAASGSVTTYRTGTSYASTSATAGTATGITLNQRYVGSLGGYSAVGSISEILIYSRTLTQTQQQNVEGYLAQKWGLTASLPAGHPGLTTTFYGTVAMTKQKVASIPKTITTSFSPTSVAACALWLDAADPAGNGVVPSNGATVSTWVDKSGNSANGTAAGGAITYNSSEKGLTFNSSYFSLPNNTISPGAAYYTIFCVVKPTSLSNYPYLWFAGTGGPAGQAMSLVFYPTGEVENGFWTDFMGLAPAGTVAINNTYMFSSAYNGAVAGRVLYKNGTSVASGTPTTTKNTQPTSSVSVGGTSQLTGVYNELIVFNSFLGTTQRQTIESYLAQKWSLTSSLPVGHPGLTTTVYGTIAAPITTTYTLSPTSITGCSLWLDAADASTLTLSGSTVTQWRDKSVNACSVYSSGGTPTYTKTAALSQGCVSFNGTTDYLTFSTFLLSQPYTIFVIATLNSLSTVGNYAFIVQSDDSGYPSNGFGASFFYYASSGTSYLMPWAGITGATTSPPLYFSAGATYVYSAIFNGSSSGVGYNGNFTSGVNPGTTGWKNLRLGANWPLTSIQSTNIGEVIFYSGALTTTQRQTVEGYLAQKWGLTASLPTGHIGLTTTLYGTVALPRQKITAISMTNYALITLSSTATTFSYTGADQTFTAPANVYAVVAYIWGAGGGGSGQPGGAGAFAQVIVPVTPGQTYTIIVGQGGTQSSSATYGGGGFGYIGNAWAGGGRSAIRYSSADIVTLGAGGGSGQDSGSTGGVANWSPLVNNGNGYDATAAQHASLVSGKGGTQTAGGAGGAPDGGLGSAYQGGAGGLNYGGTGGNSPAPTGGGGSGYYGGGGGGGGASGPYNCTGGGGGSSLLNNVIPITGGNSPNAQAQAPGTASIYYSGTIATGGTSGAGGNGKVVLTYATASSQIQGLSMSRSSTTITMTWSASSYATSYYWALYYNTANSSTGGALSSYGTTSSATATATIATGGYYYFAVSGLNASGGVSQIAFSTPLLVPQLFSVTSGLLSFFSFDKTIADFQNVITLAATGSVSYVNGRTTNQAIYLANETNSAAGTFATNYLTSSYSLTTPFSVSVWFNPTNTNAGSLLSTYNSTGITAYSVNLYINAGSMSAAYNNIQNVGASTSLTVGTWYHAVITMNASNGLSLFVNGSQVGSTITQTPSINGLMIGSIKDGGASYAFSGYMDDYRIYNRVLTGTEISAIYAGTG